MSIIRFNTEDVFNTDSSEYEILLNAALQTRDIPGMAIEIGTRRGGSAKIIIDAWSGSQKTMICVDPYGNIEYPCTNKSLSAHVPGLTLEGDPESTEIVKNVRFDYTNSMRNRIIPSLYFYAYENDIDFRFLCLEDTEYFKRYSDGMPTYNTNKEIETNYALVFLDGPHTNDAVLEELNFFIPKTIPGSVIVMDDIWMSDLNLADELLTKNNFEVLEKGSVKVSYIKT